MVRSRGALSGERWSILWCLQGEIKETHPLEKMTVRLFKLSAGNGGLEVDKDISQPEELFQRGCFGVFPGRSEYGGSTVSASYRISVRDAGRRVDMYHNESCPIKQLWG